MTVINAIFSSLPRNQEGNIKNVLERKACAFFLAITTGNFSKNLKMKSIFNYRMAVNSFKEKI